MVNNFDQCMYMEKHETQMNNQVIRPARTLAFLLGTAFSLLAIYTYLATAQMIIRDPGLVLPDATLWTAGQLEQALIALRLPVSSFAAYSLGLMLIFMLTFLTCGWLILLRKNQDWFGLFLALLLLGWANGGGVFISLPEVTASEANFYLGWFIWPGLFLLLYLFPSGHVTPRWARWFAWIWGLFAVCGLAVDMLGMLSDNFSSFIPLIVAVLLVGIYAQIYRYRHAGALERQQVKLVVFSLILMATLFISLTLILNFSDLVDPGQSSITVALSLVTLLSTLGNLAFMSVPITISIAVLRYRLWDIDVIIRRTLVYGALSALLALVFFGLVVLLQQIFGVLTNSEDSPIIIVISTLLIAVLFNPLRIRTQELIDRRFYRRKYDAEQTLVEFAEVTRSEADLSMIINRLEQIVDQAVQPAALKIKVKSIGRLEK